MSYSIERRPLGIVVRGEVPVTDLVSLTRAWAKDYGYGIMDMGIASALGVMLVVTSSENAAKWRAEIEAEVAASAPDPEAAWRAGTDVGVSATTIWSVMTGRPMGGRMTPDVPHDPSDFGRCFRLLERFPAWRARLPEVAAAHPRWAPLVDAWPALEALWREESPKEKAPRLFREMQRLNGEARLGRAVEAP